MGFFSDPAASQAKHLALLAPPVIEESPSPVKPRSSRRKRASDGGRRRRKSSETSSGSIPTLKEAELLEKPRRSSSSSTLESSSSGRRSSDSTTASIRTSTNSSIGASLAEWGNMSMSLRNAVVGSGRDSMNISMQDHMDEIESFVRHVKAADPKRRSSIFAMATQEIEEEF